MLNIDVAQNIAIILVVFALAVHMIFDDKRGRGGRRR